jgi:hypothetical protein
MSGVFKVNFAYEGRVSRLATVLYNKFLINGEKK